MDSINDAATGLGAGTGVASQLFKMLVYDEGSFFVGHRDTEFSTCTSTSCSAVFGDCVRNSSARLKVVDFPVSQAARPDLRCAGMGWASCAWPARPETGLDRSPCAGSAALRRRDARPGSRCRARSHRFAQSALARCSRRQ